MISSNLDEYNHLWYLSWLWKNSIRNNSTKESQIDLWVIYYRQEENQWKSQISLNLCYQLIIENILYLISWISIKDNNWNNHKLKKNSWFIYIYKSFSKWQNFKIMRLSLMRSFNSHFDILQRQERDASWSSEVSSLLSDLSQLILMIIDYSYTNEIKEYISSYFFLSSYESLL